MTSFQSAATGKVLLLHLTKDDDLLGSICTAVKEAGIASGIVTSGIGSLRQLSYHYIDATSDKPKDVYETIQSPMELASLQGIILEGTPHLHGVITKRGTQCHAGHLEEGCLVQYLVEVSIVEVKELPLGRRAGAYSTVTHFQWL